ncbi:sensor histidine kinase [Ancylobacter amanitiformis]|uniref:histidine kinase n=1 Tax=Ancylobacter amanitiformis TaxID=217069 RepID=A0ABU0LMZ8_9HYPH|nr:HAMP domain-containing sensor histidine kinase [Ancylobacter amanitiformis]MDQ0510081.1 signal transduction histidine kinase [Ancylobacter amanitiformis]
MALLLAVAVFVTAAAAVLIVVVLGRANVELDRLVSAQNRLELLSSISGRIGDYALVSLQSAQQPGERNRDALAAARQATLAAFQRFETALGFEVERRGDEEQRTLMAARSRTVARLRAQFEGMDRQVQAALQQADPTTAVRVVLDVFAAGFGAPLSLAMEEERTDARGAQESVHDLRESAMRWGLAGVLLAGLVAVVLYQVLGRSLVRRVADVATAAAAIAQGRTDIRLTVTGHDELSLAMARFNRMAAHLARREARLIADQRRLQEIVDARTAELRGANTRLENVDLARRRFFTDVSHELRTPLTVILGEAEVTLRGARASEEDLRAALMVIQNRARKLHRRVEDLLRIARSESGQIELERSLFLVADLLREVQESMLPLARAAGLSLEVACTSPGVAIEADRDWLRQTMDGLVANAVRHSPAGAVVQLEAERAGGEVLLRVRDHGTGIPAQELPHVFERFWRGVAGTREGPGFGIGLALAKWIVDRHGGRIDIESGTADEGGGRTGTCVTVRLPVPVPDITVEAAQ